MSTPADKLYLIKTVTQTKTSRKQQKFNVSTMTGEIRKTTIRVRANPPKGAPELPISGSPARGPGRRKKGRKKERKKERKKGKKE